MRLLYSKQKERHTLMAPPRETSLQQTEGKTHFHGTVPRDFSTATEGKTHSLGTSPRDLLIANRRNGTHSWHLPMRLLYSKQEKQHTQGTYSRDFSIANRRKGTLLSHLSTRLLYTRKMERHTLMASSHETSLQQSEGKKDFHVRNRKHYIDIIWRSLLPLV